VPLLQDAGYDVTYVEFDGGHEVPSTVFEQALDWFTV
jgi:predicted esterase